MRSYGTVRLFLGADVAPRLTSFDISTVEDVRLGSEVLFGKLHAPVPIAYRPELVEEIRGKKLKFGYYLSGLSFFSSPRLFCFSSLTSR